MMPITVRPYNVSTNWHSQHGEETVVFIVDGVVEGRGMRSQFRLTVREPGQLKLSFMKAKLYTQEDMHTVALEVKAAMHTWVRNNEFMPEPVRGWVLDRLYVSKKGVIEWV